MDTIVAVDHDGAFEPVPPAVRWCVHAFLVGSVTWRVVAQGRASVLVARPRPERA